MGSIWITNIPRLIPTDKDKIKPCITKVEHLSSYNWIESSNPTIAVPGCPPLWSPPKVPQEVIQDSGIIYIAQNVGRLPETPLEPLFRSLYIEKPSYNIRKVDLITDPKAISKLLSFSNPHLSPNGVLPFTIEIEILGNTAIFSLAEVEPWRFVTAHESTSYHHEFKQAFTKTQVPGSSGHHRVISYNLGGLKLVVSYETDAYVDVEQVSNFQAQNEGSENASPSRHKPPAGSKLVILEKGKKVPMSSTLLIKTLDSGEHVNVQELLSQLWVSQIPNLVRAYQRHAICKPPEIQDVALDIAEWECDHSDDLQRLIALFKLIVRVAREHGGNIVLKYDGWSEILAVCKIEGNKMLLDDLYFKFGKEVGTSKAQEPNSRKTTCKIGDTFYNIDISKIPYFWATVGFEHLSPLQSADFNHEDIALFDVALRGLESGYREYFCSLRGNISQYQILCQTYAFLRVDVLAGQSINDILADLRICESDSKLEDENAKFKARDAAF